jgi:hypothetical protein
LIEKKKLEYERIREQRKRFELEMLKLDQQQRKEALELAQMEEEITRYGGHQSEPTTPPEYREATGFPSMFSRPNRYSMSSLVSPPGILNRPARSGSQLISPPSGLVSNRFGFEDHQLPSQLPSRSVPTTRRNSDDEEKEEALRQDPSSHRSGNALNRYSMPVTRSRKGLYETNLDKTNTARFLFGDEEPNGMARGSTPDDHFPTLVRREDQMVRGFIIVFAFLDSACFSQLGRSLGDAGSYPVFGGAVCASPELHLPAGSTSPSPQITLHWSSLPFLSSLQHLRAAVNLTFYTPRPTAPSSSPAA